MILGHRNWVTWLVSWFVMSFTLTYRASLRAKLVSTPAGIKRLEANVERHFPGMNTRLEWHRKAADDLQRKIDADSHQAGSGIEKVDVVII